MSDTDDAAALEQRLWREIEHVRTVMLGVVGGPPRHFQPMTAFCDADEGAIWFYVRRDNHLLAEIAETPTAMMTLTTKDQGFIACVGGTAREDHDRDRIARFWNPVVAAWFPDGKDDPELTLIRMRPDDAKVWVSHSNPVRFGFEVMRANATGRTPDMGDTAHLSLGGGPG
jgi:general stress protein 26